MPNETRQLQLVLDLKDNATKQLKGFRGQLEKMQPAFRKMAIAGTAAFSAITFGVGKAVQEASRVQEIDRLFDATFNKTEDRMAKWSAEVANKFGRAEQDIRQMAATAGSVLGPAFDIAESEIADMTIGMGEAAIALAATDTRIANAQQAMEGFTQALTGNRQRVIDWGFQVRDAQLETAALERGIISAGESLNEQQKAMLTAKLITEQVSVSTQVLADSQEDWSQISKRLNGQYKELMATLGEQFLPIVEDVVSKLVPVVEKIGQWVEKNPELTRVIIIATAALVGLVAVVGTLGLILPPVIAGFALLFSPVTLVITAITALVAVVGFMIKKWDLMKSGLLAVWDILKSRFIGIWEKVKNAIQPVIDVVGSLIDKLERAIQLISRVTGGAIGGVGNMISGAASFTKGLVGIDDGVISPNGDVISTNPKDFLIATKRPQDLAGGGGTVINITGTFGSDAAEEIGDQIIRRLQLSNKLT